ncbi:MAG TPA: PAS domain S-box protein [Acidimicrobiales bacterium]|nr:PAS domain S-box protein [Acidimicrobiales bacterium]
MSPSKDVARSDQEIPPYEDNCEALLAEIVHSSDDSIIGKLLDGTITSWNRGAQIMYGYSLEEALGQNIEFITPDNRLEELSRDLQRIREGERVEHHETQRMTHDGTILDVSVTISPIRDSTGKILGASAIGRDITYQKFLERDQLLLESRLRQTERLESLGQLAGGIAHDFNNLLGVILSYVTFVGDELDDRPAALSDLAKIHDAAEKAAKLTRQLLVFARREVLKVEILNLNGLVANVEHLLERVIGDNIEFVIYPAENLWLVNADPGQMEQVLFNLAINARDAMPDGGLLTIDTANVTIDEGYAATHPKVVPGRYVRLRVNDTGSGMERTVLEHAFDPFFTTKPQGEGTGLGLPTVYGIITQLDGQIELYSEPGFGTTCKVLIPAIFDAATVIATKPVVRDLRGSETVLVVEDEHSLREATRRILEKFGYVVLTSSSGPEAIEFAQRYEGVIDLLLTDVFMPVMLGPKVADRLHDLIPELRILYTSGYAQPVLGSTLTKEVDLVEKPYSEEQLLTKVRDSLDKVS